MTAPSTTAPQAAAPRSIFTPLLLATMFSAYLGFGLIEGGFGVIWPEILDRFGISDGFFGTASFIGLLAAFPVFFFGGALSERFDNRAIVAVAFLALVAAMLIVLGGGGALPFIALMLLRGIAFSLTDLGLNALAMDYEQERPRHIMSPLHAMYSLGALGGALVVGAVFALDLSLEANFWIFGAYFLCLAIAAATTMIGRPRARRTDGQSVSFAATIALLRNREILLLAVLAAVCMFGEVLISQWAGIYLRDERGMGEGVRVIALVAYGALMFVGRMGNGPLVAWIGPRRTVLVQGTLIFAGGALIVSELPGWLAIAGCGLVGLGLAGIIPLALSVAGLAAPGQGGAASGAIMVVGYLGLASAPFVAGRVAELVSVRAVMTMEAICGAVVVVLGTRIVSRTMRRDTGGHA